MANATCFDSLFEELPTHSGASFDDFAPHVLVMFKGDIQQTSCPPTKFQLLEYRMNHRIHAFSSWKLKDTINQ